jgi:hypothetical protein
MVNLRKTRVRQDASEPHEKGSLGDPLGDPQGDHLGDHLADGGGGGSAAELPPGEGEGGAAAEVLPPRLACEDRVEDVVREPPRSGILSVAPVSAKELKEAPATSACAPNPDVSKSTPPQKLSTFCPDSGCRGSAPASLLWVL